MRELNYTVGIDRVDPSGILFGGQQGEHNATKINITLTEDLVSALVDCNNYRFEAEDGAGARRIINKGAYSNEESLSCLIPQYVTSSGGTVTVHLVFVQTDGNGEAEKICWSVAMRMRFERNISDNGYSDDEGIDDVQLLVEECKTSATAAQNAQSEAEKAKEAAETAKENTENLLNDAETGLASKVDKSQIVSKISYPTDIPNGGAVLALGEDLIRTNSVSSIEEQSLNDEAKALARSNIDAIGKQDLLKYYNLSFDGTELPAEVDLNTCVTPGTYYYNQFALTAQNMPSEWEYLSHFKLIVSKSNYIVRQVIQPGSTDQAPLITPGGCGEYMRELDAAMGTWTDWLWSLPIDPNSLTYVDYKNNQSLSDAQKEQARSNIGAVSDGDVVSNCVSDGNLLSDKIPNAYAMYEFLKSYAVVANVTQSLSDEKKARARENIGAVGKDTYELIESIVTTEECQQVTRTAEPDGTAYAFAKCLLRVVMPATTAAATVSMNISTSGGAWLAGYYKSSATRTNATTNYMLEAYQSDGIWKDRSDCVNTYSSATMNIKSISEESYKSIGKVSVSLSTAGVNLPVGTKIEIYGVRA